MKMERLTGCERGGCPAVWSTDRGTAVVQGYVVSDAEALAALRLPAGETAVEIPLSLLRKLVREVEAR